MFAQSLNSQTVLFDPIDRTLSGATIPGQSGPESNGNEGIPYITQSSKTGGTPSDGLVSSLDFQEWGGLIPLQRHSQCILQSQQTGRK